ncbi:MAG: Gfo/Idh/MocA family oxidoreductase [Eubacteriales bacterium]|jgi:predicted dehydrogenase|nr:Gfo/Idh/MocA family oxidoreductase [Eubacteriales bacterium]
MAERLKYGQVGGDLKALIGECHRKALGMEPRAELVCGCFSAIDELNDECAEAYHVDPSRVYYDTEEMAKAEEGKIDFVAICTPNFVHYSAAKVFLEHGINVMCEKPLTLTIEEAEDLQRIAKEKDLVFAVDYCYSGYVMPKVMKQMIARGDIGDIISVNADYMEGCFLPLLSETEQVNSRIWRTDPKYSGVSNTCADDGTHVEHLVNYVTGLKVKRLLATSDTFGKKLDLNDNIILEYDNGAHGAYWFSQVLCGSPNEINLRIYGTKGALEWHQTKPDELLFSQAGKATQVLYRSGDGIDVPAAGLARMPLGHPEGYYLSIANVYRSFVSTILKRKAGETPTEEDLDFPTVDDGVSGVKFFHAVVESAKNDSKWVELD